MAQNIVFTLASLTTIILSLICIRSVLSRRAKIAQQQRVAEILEQAEGAVPVGQWTQATPVNSILRRAFLRPVGKEASSVDSYVCCIRPAPAYLHDTRHPPPVRVHPNTNEEVAIEPLPIYEAPPPKYDSVVKGAQPPVEMRDLESGEPSGTTGAESGPPEYTQERGGDEGVVVVTVATDGSNMTAPEAEPRRGIFSTIRPFYESGLLGRLRR